MTERSDILYTQQESWKPFRRETDGRIYLERSLGGRWPSAEESGGTELEECVLAGTGTHGGSSQRKGWRAGSPEPDKDRLLCIMAPGLQGKLHSP